MKLVFERSPRDCIVLDPTGMLVLDMAKTGLTGRVTRVQTINRDGQSIGVFGLVEKTDRPSAEQGVGQDSAPVAESGLEHYSIVFLKGFQSETDGTVLERFASKDAAESALMQIRKLMVRTAKFGRMKSRMRFVGLYLIAPLMVYSLFGTTHKVVDLAVMAQANALMRGAQTVSQAGAAGSQALAGNPLPLFRPAEPLSQAESEEVPNLAKAQSSATLASSGMLSNAKASSEPGSTDLAPRGTFTTLHYGLASAPPERTLYVFEDPNCPACKQFVRQSAQYHLAQSYSINVFPVAFQKGSDVLAAKLLCAKDRESDWERALSDQPLQVPLSGSAECIASNIAAIHANMDQYQRLGFTSTPAMFNGAGTKLDPHTTAVDLSLVARARP